MNDTSRAVAYYRMSTDRQEDSIERQRSQVELYAARHGYAITREYIDEGIAGDEERKRKGFLRMLEDAAHLRDFSIILCDDKDRFGRFDSITSGYYIKPLRDVGVRLETVAQGRADWTSFAGRVTDAVLQEAKKIESQATSRRVLTQMVMMAKQGKWLGGRPPYGYDVVHDAETGKKLVPGDPIKVRAVQLMFRMFAEGATLEAIGKALFDRGVPNPKGGAFWNTTTIRVTLRNRKYVGDMTWNTGHEGKYSELRNGQVTTNDMRKPGRAWNPTADWIVRPDVHEALVPREQYECVQARLDQNAKKAGPFGGRRSPAARKFLLTGLLVCSHCGWRMIGTTWEQEVRYYKCGRYHAEGRHSCQANCIREGGLLRCIVDKLTEVMLNPANLQKLRDELRWQCKAEAAKSPGQVRGLERRAKDIDCKIEQGLERIAIVPGDLVPDLAAKIRAWKAEREQVEQELRGALKTGRLGEDELEAAVRLAESCLFDLRDAMEKGDSWQARAILTELVSKIELEFEHRPKGNRTKSTFRRGIIYVRPQPDLDLSVLNCLNGTGAIPIPAAPNATG
jgi:site-specific DNA recombinase